MKILILEDSISDAEIVQRLLKKEKINCEFKLAMNKNNFLQALDEFSPDVILSDNSLPQFNSAEALKISRQQFPNVPFILVTGTASEEFAADIIKSGADDYILKDRITRLPAAIEAALKQRRAKKEIKDYKYALDQAAIVSIADQNGVILYVNDNFCKISKYNADELVGQKYNFIGSGNHAESYFKDMWATIINGKIWKGEFCNRAKDESIYWVDATVVPFINEKGEPYQYLGILTDITEKKKSEENLALLEKKVLQEKNQEQKKIARLIIKAQEKERNHLGQELHDNINQVLAAIKMFLGVAASRNEEINKILKYPLELMDTSIEDIRTLSRKMVTPLKNINLKQMINELINNINKNTPIKTNFVYSVSNKLLSDDLKLNIFRIIQEQLTNILKHAEAKSINIIIATHCNILTVTISDDGKGFNVKEKRKGIGILNMINRIETFDGKIEIASSPGNGCNTEISIPYQLI